MKHVTGRPKSDLLSFLLSKEVLIPAPLEHGTAAVSQDIRSTCAGEGSFGTLAKEAQIAAQVPSRSLSFVTRSEPSSGRETP
jgi:hypothetical protein